METLRDQRIDLRAAKERTVFEAIKLYAVEIASTIVFLVFIVVETVKMVRHILAGL